MCLAANAGAQDIFWDIQNAIWSDDGIAVVRLVRAKDVDINGIHYISGADSGIPYATALASAVGYGSSNVASALLDAGADVNIRNNEGLTVLMIAENEGKADMAQLLRGARGIGEVSS